MQEKPSALSVHLTSTLPNEWMLSCDYTDLLLTITAYKLDSPTKLTQRYESVPERFEIIAESFTELASLLTTSQKGITVHQNCLVIECKIGEKLKTIKIQMKEEKIPYEEQIDNLRKLLDNQRKQQIKDKQEMVKEYNNKIIQQIEQKEQIERELKQVSGKYNQQNKILQFYEITKCTKWGCYEKIVVPKSLKYHKLGNSGWICDDKCSY